MYVPPSFFRLAYVCVIGFDVLLIGATAASDLGIEFRGLYQLDLKREGHFGVWYSSALLLAAGVAGLIVALTRPPLGVRPRFYRTVWLAIAFAFLLLSADELLQLHETLGVRFTNEVGPIRGLTEGSLAVFGWLVALLPLALLFVGSMGGVIRAWLFVHRVSGILAALALACWVCVLTAEVVEAHLVRLDRPRSVQGAVEEGLELLGTSLFLAAFCEFLRRPTSILNEKRGASEPAVREVPPHSVI